MTTDYNLPPPDSTVAAFQAKGVGPKPVQSGGPTSAVDPQETAQFSPTVHDDMQISPFLRGSEHMTQDVNSAIQEFNKLAHEQLPLAEKVAKLTGLLSQAAEPYNRRGDDRSLSQLRNAAGELAQQLFKGEIESVKGSEGLSPDEKQSRLQDLRHDVEQVEWLSTGFQSGLKLDVNFAVADIKMGRH